ncbi:MAG: preprotein translocase subunit SecE [Candidatus Komeilibacteria bacterium]|jgi:preprotein translocase subunit SecE|nr:preprotein translocase subunit SecE [Candidatus Komeilibacteria bacterium]MBT4447249.1 preprotein translocase subunit SecE [Candidatus Komeilibacteria bacterium]
MNKILNYFKGAKEELSKVVWPTRQTTINHTLMVIGVSITVAIFLGVVDLGLSKVVESLIK